MSTSARRRLLRDFRRLQTDPPSGVTGAPMNTNIMCWQAVIFGPDDTPWEGGTFKLVLEFTEDYPNKAPQVRFLTKMFHPNIYADGQICLDILQNQWSPIYDISAILTSIQSLLCDPNPASPANSEASRLFNENRREYNRRVREIVEQSWVDESWKWGTLMRNNVEDKSIVTSYPLNEFEPCYCDSLQVDSTSSDTLIMIEINWIGMDDASGIFWSDNISADFLGDNKDCYDDHLLLNRIHAEQIPRYAQRNR